VSPTARIPLQHSWKAHVNSRISNAATGSSGIDARTERGATSRPVQWEDEVEDTRSTVPAPYSSTRGASSSNRDSIVGNSSTRRLSSSALPNRVSVSYDDTEFGLYKVRLVTLKRLFASWATWCADSQRRLAQCSRDVLENRLYWPKQSAFSWWRLLYRAVRHAQVQPTIYLPTLCYRCCTDPTQNRSATFLRIMANDCRTRNRHPYLLTHFFLCITGGVAKEGG
jgi:hypothetical protein